MKKILFFLFLTLLLSSCGPELEVIKESTQNGIVNFSVISPSVDKNLVKEEKTRTLTVYLPPGYEESEKKYPVIYFLHGFSESPDMLQTIKVPLDIWFSEHPQKACIAVGVDGRNQYGGSFYVNSLLTGDWEDFTSRETVSFIDSRFRTLARASSRGIIGFSMGGFGAIHNALRHPGVYSVLFAVSPGLFDPSGLRDAVKTWNSGFKRAYGLAFSADPEIPDPFYAIPVFDGSSTDNKAVDLWESGFGDLAHKIEEYKEQRIKLKSIHLMYGKNDHYTWIPRGTEYFSRMLTTKGINNTLHVHDGGHLFYSPFIVSELLPAVTEQLEFEKED